MGCESEKPDFLAEIFGLIRFNTVKLSLQNTIFMSRFIPNIFKVIAHYFLFNRNVRILLVFASILSTVAIILYRNSINPFAENIDELEKQLITTSGIFTALMLTILMPKFSERGSERKLLISQYKEDCKRLAAFRSFMHFTKHFDMFKKSASLQHKYLKGRSFLEYTESAKFNEELWELLNAGQITGEDIGNMEFYGAIRDFSYEATTGGISFYSNYSEYTFSLEKLEYLHECCRRIWYSMDKYSYIRNGFKSSYATHSSYWTQRMIELIPCFTTIKIKKAPKDIADFTMSQAGEYEQIISNMINNMHKILYDLTPKIFSSISIDTIFIITFGLIIPLYTLLFRVSKFTGEAVGLLCFSVTTTFIISFLFDTYLFFNKDIFRENNEKEKYYLYPKDGY